MILDINSVLGSVDGQAALVEEDLRDIFEKHYWKELQTALGKIPKSTKPRKSRSVEEMFEELLEETRASRKEASPFPTYVISGTTYSSGASSNTPVFATTSTSTPIFTNTASPTTLSRTPGNPVYAVNTIPGTSSGTILFSSTANPQKSDDSTTEEEDADGKKKK